MCYWSALASHFGGDLAGVASVDSHRPGSQDVRERFPMRGGSAEELEVRCDGGNGYRVQPRVNAGK